MGDAAGVTEAAAAWTLKGYFIPDRSGLKPQTMPSPVCVQYKKKNCKCPSSEPFDLSACLLIFSVSPVFPLPLPSFIAYIVQSVYQLLKVQPEINKIVHAVCVNLASIAR